MGPASRLELLPPEVLNLVFLYLASGKPSDHLATGKIDESFRALFFTSTRLAVSACDYYYSRKAFMCHADDLTWETIYLNTNPHAIEAFSHCMTRLQHLEVKIRFFGAERESVNPDKSLLLDNLERLDIQIADLDSLRCYLERCKRQTSAATLKSIVLVSKNPAHADYVVVIASNHNGLIRERDMYLAVFKPFEERKCIVSLEHRIPIKSTLEVQDENSI